MKLVITNKHVEGEPVSEVLEVEENITIQELAQQIKKSNILKELNATTWSFARGNGTVYIFLIFSFLF